MPDLASSRSAHDPSALGALGIAHAFFGWAALLSVIWQQHGPLLARVTVGGLLAGAFSLSLGAGLVIASTAASAQPGRGSS